MRNTGVTLATFLGGILVWASSAVALEFPLAPDRVPDVSNTRHNFSVDGPASLKTGEQRNVKSTDQKEVCVYCHVPHDAEANTLAPKPQWAREALEAAWAPTYTLYSSTSTDATLGQPGTASKMCLSCHDGTLSVATVGSMTGSGVSGDKLVNTATGYNANLGTDLSNDHPIAFTYDTTLATNDGELVDPAGVSYIDSRVGRKAATASGTTVNRMPVPLEAGNLECTSCHDPHIRGTNGDEGTNIKFLRLNRFQKTAQPIDGTFNIGNDIGCLACHRKDGWGNSVHAHSQVADETYATAPAATREFPDGIQVWQASCLNCHDAHTVDGAQRLLREGTDDTNTPKQAGGNPSINDTCYQCHTTLVNSDQVLTDVTAVADVETVEGKLTNHRMGANNKAHSITDSHLSEAQANLGSGHDVQCTDCHHPHRMTANATVVSDPTTPDSGKGGHVHTAGVAHTNIASGSLRGVSGVEPTSVPGAFDPTTVTFTYDLKKGDPGLSVTTNTTDTYVTREYQVCLKCHSDYPSSAPVTTNAAMEFHVDDVAEGGEPGGNHRSWHPVMKATGRSSVLSVGAAAATFEPPFDAAVGTQTMYCSDCHTNNDPTGPSGPHGSTNNKVLAGQWDNTTGQAGTGNHLCFNCHKFNEYGQGGTGTAQSGFSCAGCVINPNYSNSNLHLGHMGETAAKEDGPAGVATPKQIVCQDCHVRLSHGWKNKGMLADKGDATDNAYEATYFDNLVSRLTVTNYKASGNWTKADCSSCH